MRIATAFLAASVLVSSAGCGTGAPRWILPDPPAESVRAGLGRVVVKVDDQVLASLLEPPIASWRGAMLYGGVLGMAAVATAGLAMTAAVGRGLAGSGSGWGACVVLFLMGAVLTATLAIIPLGACFGSLWGLSQGPSGEEIARGRAVLAAALRTARVEERLRSAVVETARRRAQLPVAEDGPADALLLVGRPRVMLSGPWRFDPPLTLHADVRFRLVRVRDGAELYATSLGMTGSTRSFADWTADRGSLAAWELTAGTAGFADRLVEEIFLLHPLGEARLP